VRASTATDGGRQSTAVAAPALLSIARRR
jgi:hypothetical protein